MYLSFYKALILEPGSLYIGHLFKACTFPYILTILLENTCDYYDILWTGSLKHREAGHFLKATEDIFRPVQPDSRTHILI